MQGLMQEFLHGGGGGSEIRLKLTSKNNQGVGG